MFLLFQKNRLRRLLMRKVILRKDQKTQLFYNSFNDSFIYQIDSLGSPILNQIYQGVQQRPDSHHKIP